MAQSRLGPALRSFFRDIQEQLRESASPPHSHGHGTVRNYQSGRLGHGVAKGSAHDARAELSRRQLERLPKKKKKKTHSQEVRSRSKAATVKSDIRKYKTLAAEVVRLTNVERAKAGVTPLRISERLTNSAQRHSMAQANNCKARHAGFTPETATPEARMVKAGYHPWKGVAENVASGQKTAEQVVNSWKASRGHRKNMLSPEWRDIGVGIYPTSRNDTSAIDYGSYYWTQNFGVLH